MPRSPRPRGVVAPRPAIPAVGIGRSRAGGRTVGVEGEAVEHLPGGIDRLGHTPALVEGVEEIPACSVPRCQPRRSPGVDREQVAVLVEFAQRHSALVEVVGAVAALNLLPRSQPCRTPPEGEVAEAGEAILLIEGEVGGGTVERVGGRVAVAVVGEAGGSVLVVGVVAGSVGGVLVSQQRWVAGGVVAVGEGGASGGVLAGEAVEGVVAEARGEGVGVAELGLHAAEVDVEVASERKGAGRLVAVTDTPLRKRPLGSLCSHPKL